MTDTTAPTGAIEAKPAELAQALREAIEEALSEAESVGHPLNGGSAARRALAAKQEIWPLLDALAALSHPAAGPENLHAAITNLPCEPINVSTPGERVAFRAGHREARIAAAKLVRGIASHPAVPLRLEACDAGASGNTLDALAPIRERAARVGPLLIAPFKAPGKDDGASVPKGWKLVPEEPTNAMILAAAAPKGMTSDGYPNFHTTGDKYRAMLAAAPSPAPAPHASQAKAGQDEQDRKDAARWRAARDLGKSLKVYVYDDADDPTSGDWLYNPSPDVMDRIADELIAKLGGAA